MVQEARRGSGRGEPAGGPRAEAGRWRGASPTWSRAARKQVAKTYTPSQKAEAVERAAAHGVSATSAQLGMSRFSIYVAAQGGEGGARSG
jgi:hypothetical protein